METNGGNENGAPSNYLQLYVKAGENMRNYGACPFCQMVYMIMDLKAREGELTYDVVTISMSRPPLDFKKLANRLPVLKHGDEILSDNDEIVQYLDKNFPHPDLRYDNEEANAVCLNFFSKFSFYIKQVKNSPENLLKELAAINAFLERSGTRYLCGDTISNLDCLVLPKLQHIRVACKALKDFDIPASMKALWKYIGQAYESTTFRKTCPSDQEIVYHWSQKAETPHLSDEKMKEYSTDKEPKFSVTIPDLE
ncbi:chloride intracellular channel protein 2-like isoform X1 [Mercenaria mercenaria]|uniref:chloride intracellular channel protein 2-like isoform X1 n=1 Tax=Mercenaria mercenaria TaxID=6596 RepID=UPI00234F3FB4|nr:chloride intracellular channel protein 2-like isoform X1 [Mercenaria mercenaria]XP_045163392.2 chloride intracellular channel protein 2-like isoform X1 [Mercenaria mercenaria]XP_045163393.2 chloride intracellular channel protein 2-like isoform X1 [Mercenaria mercenaria]XP_045163394.2 chloride intracellular channel protein 2-like isoform X1 [Mercenaria mercenaria]XP_045163395.2 chloride intracellular channel protein 2-like isoform X1 [Mercenaria mercenaria]